MNQLAVNYDDFIIQILHQSYFTNVEKYQLAILQFSDVTKMVHFRIVELLWVSKLPSLLKMPILS